MCDMLVKLYEMENDWEFMRNQTKLGVTIRKPIGPEKHVIVDWVTEKFGDAWGSETAMAISNRPASCFVAVKDRAMVGFACYDATALGYFGPIGVEEGHRSEGTGTALLLACLLDMKLKGYGYAIIGAVQNTAFFTRAVGAVEIPDSSPGILKTWLKRRRP
jgi:ribosomal protein S18 acetylase RimI-like enzyme